MTGERADSHRRVLLLAPTARDGEATRRLLASAGIDCTVCDTLEHVCAESLAGAAAVIVPEEVVLSDGADLLAERLRQQPVWSDLPVIVLSRSGVESQAVERALATLGNVSLIERPMRVSTLLSVVRAALRARERQYQVRDHLDERQRAERELRTFKFVTDNANDSLLLIDEAGRIVYTNRFACEALGYAEGGMRGLTVADIDPVYPLPRFVEFFERAKRERVPAFETIHRRQDGSEFPVEVTTSVMEIDGKPYVFAAARDITERKVADGAIRRAKDEAERSLAQWQAVVGSMTEGLVLADPRGDLLMMNPAALALHEFGSMREMLTKLADYPNLFELRDLLNQVLPFDAWPISRALRGERFVGCEVHVHRRDTNKTWIGSYGGTAARDEAGNVTLAVLTVSDVTQERQNEAAVAESDARFRQLAETIPQLAWMAKPDGWIFWYNRRWYAYTGTTPQQMEGWGWQSVHDPAELPRVMDRWQHSIRTGEPFELEFPIKSADGRFRSFLTRVEPLRDANGNITLWFGTNTDIEDRRRIAEERAQLLEAERAARVEAERASHMKDEFLATLSHELRTPLNAILGWSQILAGGAKDEDDLAEGLRTIERNARAQTQIIEDLLDMSRIISGKVRLDVQRIDLAPVVHGAVESLKPAAEAKGIRLQAVLDPMAGPVSGDPNRLQQVLWNLLTNAVKFTPKGGRVQVVLSRVNSHVEISVSDTGEGIKPEFLPHVFDRFRQADASTTRRHGGLGLGLAIVKQLVELHGGGIRVNSPGAGMGATFTVSLPVSVLHAEPDNDRPRRHPVAAAAAGVANPAACISLAGVRVLVVDDEPDALNLVRRLLENCDAVVSTAASASEAMRILRADPPDVVVSDIGMPNEDGYAFIRQVRALGPQRGGDVPAVALTAYARSEDRTRSVLAGFHMHVAKPVEPTELITMVASLARRTR